MLAVHFFLGEPVSGVFLRNWRVSAAHDNVGSLEPSIIQWLGELANNRPRCLGSELRLRISRSVCCKAGEHGEILAVMRDDIVVTWDRIAVRWDHIVVGRDWCVRSRDCHGVRRADLARIAGW